MATLKTALMRVHADYPNIFDNPLYIWNMDETDVTGEKGAREKVFSSSGTHHGGFKGVAGKGIGKHLTAVVATAASGKKISPFLLFEGKHQMERWFEPLNATIFKDGNGPEWFAQECWMPSNAVMIGTDKGSMDQSTITSFVQHFNR